MNGVVAQDIHEIIYEFIWFSCECFTNRNVCHLVSFIVFFESDSFAPYTGFHILGIVRKLTSVAA